MPCRSAFVSLVLLAALADARADVTLTERFASNGTLSGPANHVRIFAEDYTRSPYYGGSGTYIDGSAALSADLGTVTNALPLNGGIFSVAYAGGSKGYATLLATIGSGTVLVATAASNSAQYGQVAAYLSAGTNFADVYGSISATGALAPLVALAGDQESGYRPTGVFMSSFDPMMSTSLPLVVVGYTRSPSTGVVSYDAANPYGYASILVTPQATPEPSALAALGLGAVALRRRSQT